MSSYLSEASTGVVTEFSDPSGLGVITDESGRQWPFHCVSLEDGTRTIETGSRVRFVQVETAPARAPTERSGGVRPVG